MPKQMPVSQIVTRARAQSSCVRWPTAPTRDRALVAVLRLWIPAEWR